MAAARAVASPKTLYTMFFRSFSSSSPSPSSFLLGRLRPFSVAAAGNTYLAAGHGAASTRRTLATKAASSSLNDPSPNWSNRPPKETILLDGCDFEHWLVVMEKPEGDPTRDEIIDYYIKTLAGGLQCSEDEARMKIYSVSTRCYYAFGALVSEELSYKLKELPKVRWVLPDSYLDVKNKDYGGEPFIDGKAVPYDPKYHEEWIRNHNKANERNRRNDRPRNFDRSRNFDRRRENMQNRDSAATPNQGPPQAAGGPPPPNNFRGGPGGPPPPPPSNYMGGPGGSPPPSPDNYMGGPGGPPPPPPSNYMGGRGGSPPPPPNNYMGGQQNMGGGMQNFGAVPQNNMGGVPQYNPGGVHQNNGAGWPNNVPGSMQQNSQNGPNTRGMPYQGGHNYQPPNYHNPQNRDGSMPGGNPYAA